MKLIYMVCTVHNLAAMCDEKWETDIYVPQNWSQLIEGSVLKMKHDHATGIKQKIQIST